MPELLFSAPLISDSAATVAATTQTAVEQSQQTPIIPSSLHHHHHGHHSGVLNPNAAWFALASVIIKEWLYRASKVIQTVHHASYQLTTFQ